MANTRSSARSRTSGRARRKSQSRLGWRHLFAAFGWLGAISRPRTGSQLLALLLVLLGLATIATVLVAALLSRHNPGFQVVAGIAILAAAAVARSSPWWRPQIRAMTRERAQTLAGSAVLFLVAVSISWHALAGSLGFDDHFAFLWHWDQLPSAAVALALVAALAFLLILDVPVLRSLLAGGTAARYALGSAMQPHVLRSTEVAYAPAAPQYEEQALDDLPEGPAPRALPVKSLRPAPLGAASSASAMPPVDIFSPAVKNKAPALDQELISQRIQETLASFGVRARVVGHHSGPVVTQFDVQPDRGVKVKSITSLQNDLALALAAPTIRIQAPVPGKPVVGIEIPNASATIVSLRELLESDAYRTMKSPLSVVLGKDVAGVPAVIDLARMPHLLIAGATGSGKSVCINALIGCLLYRNKPEDVRLMMIDPKMVELTVYNGVPHLLSPVVTQMDKVVGVLQWALREMERRYRLFADNSVRNIARYNENLAPNGTPKLPYIVLIIDELADLMMVAPEDVEDAVCRLAQLARAAGIHLVIATQRPSVDVVTGLIKANFPARIAFAMTSQVDSRTILDKSGAEKLLGRGDMLYMPPDGPAPIRLQGANVSDPEIERLVEFWQSSPLQAAVERVAAAELIEAEKTVSDTDDALLSEAKRVVREYQHASVSLLQRRLRIGYSRAARVMDQLEAYGIVGPADGSKQRPVLDAGDEAGPAA